MMLTIITNKEKSARAILKALGIAPNVHSFTIHFPPGKELPMVTVERYLDVKAGEELATVLESFVLLDMKKVD